MVVPLPRTKAVRKPAPALRVTYLTSDFDAPAPNIAALFEGDVSEEWWTCCSSTLRGAVSCGSCLRSNGEGLDPGNR
jgi:hypothetical protein